jgi:hypothetical protein
VPIQPFLVGQPFEPELIEQMSAALVRACEALDLHVMDAQTIIDFAQRGFRDADSLLEMTLQVFGIDKK